MQLDDFDFFLPPELIAQHPSPKRDASRLMTLRKDDGTISETGFSDITRLFRPGDLLVINDTKVIPARLFGFKESGGRVEVFLVRRLATAGQVWHCLVKASKPLRSGTNILLAGGLEARALEQVEGGGLGAFVFSP